MKLRAVLNCRRLWWQLFRHRIIERPAWRIWQTHWYRPGTDATFVAKFSVTGGERDPDLVVKSIRRRATQTFFFDPSDRHKYLPYLECDSEQVLRDADEVLRNTFDVLGSGPVCLGDRINWHRDFKSGRCWPLVRPNQIDEISQHDNSDVKVPWDLSRFHFVPWLGKAYWLTGDEKYARHFASLIDQWIENNPFGLGIHWMNAMEVAIRACNWILALGYFSESPSITEGLWMRIYRVLWLHGNFIRYNLEVERVVGNHLVADGAGLVFLGTLFNDTPQGRSWLRMGTSILEREAAYQVQEDGVDYEKSTSYHRLVLELFYSSFIVGRKAGVKWSKGFCARLERMFMFTLHYMRPDGTAAAFGDCDDGRLFRFTAANNFEDHRHALAIGAALFRRSDLWQAAGGHFEDLLWLLGPQSLTDCSLLQAAERPCSKAFPSAGYYILRSNDVWLMADAGPIGPHEWGGHGHRDTFGFELSYRGELFLTDSGTPCYTSNIDLHRQASGTAAHNAVTVDDQDVADWAGIWRISGDQTQPRVLLFEITPDSDILVAEHHGYQRLAQPVLHRRSLTLHKPNSKIRVEDVLTGRGEHEYAIYFHLAAGVAAEGVESLGKRWKLRSHGVCLDLKCSIPLSAQSSEIWPRYGVRLESVMLVGKIRSSMPLTITTELIGSPTQSSF